ncbi:MAG: VanZ family protein [Patescibacteria group bacterium]|nr:VanZ family protein [Patescibacteria group bacterium]
MAKSLTAFFRRLLNWAALLGWIGVIFWFSSQPDLKSGLETWQDMVLRKGAHMAEYFVAAYLALRCWSQPVAYRALPMAGAALFVLAVASTDEFYQTTVAGRHGSPVDVGIDVLGGIMLLMLGAYLRHRRRLSASR